MKTLQDIKAFVEVARTGSFVRAGEVLNQSNSAVSKAIARLEQELGVPLLRRTTRHLSLTEEGHAYYASCQKLLDDLERADDAVTSHLRVPQGVLRVHFPLLWAREVVVPALPDFYARYPQVHLQMVFAETSVQLSDAFDVSIQVGPTVEGRFVIREICSTRSLIAASPEYLQRAGTPEHPDDLHKHDCVRFMMSDRMAPVPWTLQIGGQTRRMEVRSRLDLSDPQAMVQAAVAGLGLVQGPDFLVRPHIEAGRLQQVLAPWEADGPPIAVVWSKDRYTPLRLRVFVDWLLELRKHAPAPLSRGGKN
ncbi:MAG: LysR family transcriptional regulator [Steroidobacteraceae bacterium]